MEFLSGLLLGIGCTGVAFLLMLTGGINANAKELKDLRAAIEGTSNRRPDASEWWKDGTVEGDWS